MTEETTATEPSNVASAPDLPGLILAIKLEVLSLMKEGRVPSDASSFSALHDYCDANCLGGLCENKVFDTLIAQHGGWDERDGMPQGMLDLINAAQETVGAWLNDRWPAEMEIAKDMLFTDAPGSLGAAWYNLAVTENHLADLLRPYPKGTAAVLNGNAWFLNEIDGRLVLCVGDYADHKVTDPKSRHEIGLEWVDHGEEQLEDATSMVSAAAQSFELVYVDSGE